MTDKRMRVPLRDLDESWSLEDLRIAHEMLDALDEADALLAMKK